MCDKARFHIAFLKQNFLFLLNFLFYQQKNRRCAADEAVKRLTRRLANKIIDDCSISHNRRQVEAFTTSFLNTDTPLC